ncbi:hypothetical protein GE061_010056 [Apolygus lucorum]|uniref:Uncharacterized protein n=1 Tax=Apolygus lucorum TaxID=248454 RepID=A0A6A4JW54_APOLU|nr:hypothetical protein GE061_010056 [Apolygus lucorum]
MFDHLIVIYCAAYIVARCGGSDGEKNSPAEKRSGIRPRLPEDSEISNPNWQVPDNWTKQEDGAEFSGLLFAGKAEFSWIVDIRLEDQDLENWSIGNLITYAHVMTSCRAVAHLDDKFKKEDDESTIKLRETEMRIYFCSEYLWEKNGQDYEENYIDFSGARSIRGVILHPKCTLESFLYDFGVIELSKGIHPFVPNIGYMPINRKLSTGLIVNPHLQWMETKRWVCYVASYGKSYRNLKDNIAQDYKVKYRVYHANWRECEKYLYYICPIYIKVSFTSTRATTVTPSFPDDPDTWIPLEPPLSPGDEHYWSEYSRQADAVGLLLAGGSEFPWIVDIRLTNHDQEIWSVGNLATDHHVLTTCRAMWNFVGSPWDFNENRKKFKNPRIHETIINFCGTYLWEAYDQTIIKTLLKEQEDKYVAGTRSVKQIMLHPKCDRNSFEYDVSIVEMKRGIPPKIPQISYMPVPEHPITGDFADPDFSMMEEYRWVCHIASFGKNSFNIHNNTANDYKVKYRVYFMDWDKCTAQYFDRLCPKTYGYCTDILTKYPFGKLMCFKSHAKVGSICDHDIGAPLVCNGFVMGLVVRGVDFKFCHNLTPFPAIVRKINYDTDYFMNLILDTWTQNAQSRGESVYGNSALTAIIGIIYVSKRIILVC